MGSAAQDLFGERAFLLTENQTSDITGLMQCTGTVHCKAARETGLRLLEVLLLLHLPMKGSYCTDDTQMAHL